MAPVEVVVMLIALLVGAICWWRMLAPGRVLGAIWRRPGPLSLEVAALASVLALGLVLVTWSSHDVRSSVAYVIFYLAIGFGWTSFVLLLFGWVGLSVRDDVIERRNRAAALALGGALLGATLAYAGANIGDGPGFWVVFWCAGLATAGLFAAWMFVAANGGAERITVDRDVSAGLRVAGLLTAAGLILGRSVAGDWTGGGDSLIDWVRQGWPALLLGVAEALVTRFSGAGQAAAPAARITAAAVASAALYVAVAGLYVYWLGRW